jgi:hypothetical protein
MPTLECPRRSLALWVDAANQHVGGVRMAQIVEAHAREGGPADHHHPGVCQAAGLHRLAILARVDEGRLSLTELLRLHDAVHPQLLEHHGREGDGTDSPGFRLLVPHALLRLLAEES